MPVEDMNEIIVQDDENRLIKGFASVEVLDRQFDLVPVSTMQKAMIQYMNRGALLLYGHKNMPIGKVINWSVQEEKNYGVPAIEIIGMVNRGYKLDDEVWKLIKSGKLTGFSIGGTALEIGKAVMKDGSEARVLQNIELSEISIVEEPANQGAVITNVSIAKSSPKKYDEMNEEELAKAGEEIVKSLLIEFAKSGEVGKKAYPWSQCMRDHHSKKLCGWIRANYGKSFGMEETSLDYIMHTFIITKEDKKSRPSSSFMSDCVADVGKYLETLNDEEPNKEYYDTEGDKRRLCGFIWYYIFGGDTRKAEEWAWADGVVTEDMISSHQVHAGVKYGMGLKSIKHINMEFELPPQNWLLKCVGEYEGSADGYKACALIWNEHYDIDKGVPVVDGELEHIAKYIPAYDKAISSFAEISKPFAGFKDWADCQRKFKDKYGKEARNKVCGRLKADYEKRVYGDEKELERHKVEGRELSSAERERLWREQRHHNKLGRVGKQEGEGEGEEAPDDPQVGHELPENEDMETGEHMLEEVPCPDCEGENIEIVNRDDVSDIVGDREVGHGVEYTAVCRDCGKKFKYILWDGSEDIDYEGDAYE